MQEILGRLPAQVFKIVVFDERTILEEPVERWPVCECLIAFHSKGFPLGKAIDYATLRKPFVVVCKPNASLVFALNLFHHFFSGPTQLFRVS